MPAQPERTKRLIRELKKLDPAVPLNQPATAKALGYQSAMRLQHYRRDHPGYLPEPDVVEELGTPEDPRVRRSWYPATLIAFLREDDGRPSLTPAQTEETKRLVNKLKALDQDVTLTARAVAKVLEYQNDNQITNYLRDHPGYFPDPDVVEELGTLENPRVRRSWYPATLIPFVQSRPGSGRHAESREAADGSARLPEAVRGGDPDELLGATQVAALLGYKSVNTFSSALAQKHRRLAPLRDTSIKVKNPRGGPPVRRWPRKIVESIE